MNLTNEVQLFGHQIELPVPSSIHGRDHGEGTTNDNVAEEERKKHKSPGIGYASMKKDVASLLKESSLHTMQIGTMHSFVDV